MVLDRALRDAYAREAPGPRVSTSAENAGALSFEVLDPTAAFELMTASVALYDSL